jgi:hypothetical protein
MVSAIGATKINPLAFYDGKSSGRMFVVVLQ